MPSPVRPPLLERLGLHRAELRAWALYDWANSGFLTVVVTAVFPIYFSSVLARGLEPAAATARFGAATTVALALVALLAPILGTVADQTAAKRRFLAGFLALGAAATALLALVRGGQWLPGLVLFVLANVGLNGSFVFYDALLPHIARRDEVDRVSTAGYALGYLGGGLLLALALALIQRPAWFGLPSGPGLDPDQATLPVRVAFALTALWWAVFAIPLFRRVPEPPPAPRQPGSALAAALAQLRATGRRLGQHRDAALMLAAFLLYNDGIQTIIRMATVYGTEIGLERGAMIAAIVIVQFVGIPFAFAFGALAARIGPKPAILLAVAAYAGIAVLGYRMQTERDFLVLAVLVGMVQGGAQALSRSLFASLIPRDKSGEFFGFFAVFEKVAGIAGPGLFTLAVVLTGSSRAAILSVIVLFVAGGALLLQVDVERGRRAAA